MENPRQKQFSELEAAFGELPPHDQSREVYLVAVLFREELGFARPWSYELDRAKNNYVRSVGEMVNTTIEAVELAGGGAEEIEDIIVHCLCSEAQHRWLAYSNRIIASDKEAALVELLPQSAKVTTSLPEKADHIRQTWRQFLEDYGVSGGAFYKNIRAEFVCNTVTWDIAQEDKFMRDVMSFDDHEVAA